MGNPAAAGERPARTLQDVLTEMAEALEEFGDLTLRHPRGSPPLHSLKRPPDASVRPRDR